MQNRKLVLAFKTFVAEFIRWAQSPPTKPGAFALSVSGETTETIGGIVMKKNNTTITLPAVADGNPEGVKVRKFSVVSGETTLFNQDFDLPDGAVNVDPVVVKIPQGVETTLTLIDVDQAGNASPQDTLVFTPTDVTPPSQPGAFKVEVSGEVDE